MTCHQWCDCSKCTTHYNSSFQEIPNPHSGSYYVTSEMIIADLKQENEKLKKEIAELKNKLKTENHYNFTSCDCPAGMSCDCGG